MKELFISLLLLFLVHTAFGQQNPCLSNQNFKIVVLGSSTSAGTGASQPDSAWVNRYTAYLQGINPANEVINFGVGGYNTYRIMPSGFIPPVNRPNPDPARNISAALAENPDAIIVNMPSNDVAAGFTYAEQMFNLDTIVSIAQQNNVPIWICTTQPRNFGNQAQLDLQWELKDSIYAYFNPYTIDFWTTIATPSYTIEPFYDSGDGVHLNDFGHGLLAERVIQTSILDSIYVAPDSVDYKLVDLAIDPSVCGDSITQVQVVIANIGLDNTDTTDIELTTLNTLFATSETDQFQIATGLASCSADTITFNVNTYEFGNYQMTATVSNNSDSILLNNIEQILFSTTGHPSPTLINDTLCNPGMAELFTLTNVIDQVFWYDDILSTTPISQGATLTIPLLDTTTYYYSQSVRGNLFYSESLHSTLNSNINFNGTMFDLVASDSLVIDSFDVKIASLGMQSVEVFYKLGSHLGFETDPTSWTYLDDATVNVIDPSAWTNVPVGGLSISQGDTVGIHVRMQDPNANLSYQNVSAPISRSTPELEMITGSGMSANFGNNYYPRDWSGGVYYHFGERPLGDCASERLEAVAFLSESELIAGTDTIIDITDTLFTTASSGFIDFNWSNGSDSASAILPAVDFGEGIHYIDVYATDSLGCERYDQFVLAVADLVGLEDQELAISISPNPTKGLVHIQTSTETSVRFTDTKGQEVKVDELSEQHYSLHHLPSGIYLIHIAFQGETSVQKIVKTE
jgi:lysophospholipase L1-like esterase